MHDEMSRRSLLRMGILGAGALSLPGVLSACGSSGSATAGSNTPHPTSTTDPLLGAAKAEGRLNLIAVADGANSPYASVLDGFRKRSGLQVNLISPSAGSGIEMDTIRQRKGRPDQPDVVDVGLSSALEGTAKGLFTPVRPTGWEDIPSTAKDVNGAWVSTYYALVGIVSNPAKLGSNPTPTSFDDLAGLTGGVTVGFPGDPRTTQAAGPLSSASAFGAIWTAALAKGGTLDDISPGIDYFRGLARDGIFDPAKLAIAQTLANGSVAIGLLLNSDFERAKGFLPTSGPQRTLNLRIAPSTALYPNYFAQAAVKGSPHPNAAKLWIDYLVSDAGAKALLTGGLVPTRFPVLQRQGSIVDADLKRFTDVGLPAAKLSEALAAVQIPTVEQVNRAQDEVNRRWGPEVRGEKS